MKQLLAAALLAFCLGSSAFEVNSNAVNLKINDGKFGIFAKGSKCFGWLDLPPEDASLITVQEKNGELLFDTRAYYAKYPTGKNIMIGWHGLRREEFVCTPKDGKPATKRNRMEVVGSASAGCEVDLLVLANKGPGFWTVKKQQFSGRENETLVLEPEIPEGVESIWLRTDLKSPGIYRFHSVKFLSYEPRGKERPDASVNHIRNGGAESGYSNLFTQSLEFARHTATGKYIDWRGVSLDFQNEVSIDRSTAHTGRCSWKMVRKGTPSYGRLHFNPVPYRAGEPTSFTAWMKADRPMHVDMGLFLANGCAASRIVSVGTEWAKYEFYMPSWGAKGKEFQVFGNIINAYPAPTGLVMPYITPEEKETGTLWIDSVSYAIGGHSRFQDNAPFHLRTTHARKSGYYYTGETVRATAEAENYTEKPLDATLSVLWKDWTGKVVQQSSPRKITLKKGERKTVSFDLLPPKTLRGPVNLTFVCKSASHTEESTLYFGVIDRNRTPNHRIGIEVTTMQNMKCLMPYLKDFRIGILRIGTASSGSLWQSFDQLPYLKSQGIRAMLSVSMNKEERDNPERWKAWCGQFQSYVKKYAGMAEYYETQNEPNISGWSIDNNWKQIQVVADTVRKYDPSAKVAGPTTCGIDYTWISAILSKGGKDLFDAVTYHPYRKKPELPDYTQEAERLQKTIDSFRRIPQMGTEAGHVVPPAMTDQTITDYVRDTAALDIRNIIQGFAGGAERYYHFCLDAKHCGSAWQLVFMGNPGTDNTPVPNVMFFALRNLIDRLETAKAVGRAKLGLSYRAPIFDHGPKRTAVLWKWQGEPSLLRFSPEDAAKLTAYDFCGNRCSADSLTIGAHPFYLETTLSTGELTKLLENASLTGQSGNRAEVESLVSGERSFVVVVRNTTGRPFDCRLSVLTPGAVTGSSVRMLNAIPGEGSGQTEFQLKQAVSTTARKLRLRMEIPSWKEVRETEVDLRAVLVRKTPKALVIDGDLSDWPANAVRIRLDKHNTDPRGHHGWGKAEEKITANLRYAWDDNFLYASAEVFKPDLHTLPNAARADLVWKYDSVQICFDPLRNAAPERESLEDDDFEYSIGLMGGKARVYRRWASIALYDSLNKEQGLLPEDEIPVAIRKYADRTVYEIAFPRRAVSPFRLLPNSAMRLSTLVNINNGKERAGFLELTPGIGYRKMPGQWMEFVLLP